MKFTPQVATVGFFIQSSKKLKTKKTPNKMASMIKQLFLPLIAFKRRFDEFIGEQDYTHLNSYTSFVRKENARAFFEDCIRDLERDTACLALIPAEIEEVYLGGNTLSPNTARQKAALETFLKVQERHQAIIKNRKTHQTVVPQLFTQYQERWNAFEKQVSNHR